MATPEKLADLARLWPQASKPALLLWRELLGLGLVGWGSQLPLARDRKDSLQSDFLTGPPQFFSLPPNTSHPPSAQIYFLSTPSILSSFFHPQSPLNPFFLFKGKPITAAIMSSAEPQKVLGMPVSFSHVPLDHHPDPLDRQMPADAQNTSWIIQPLSNITI